ncbi:DUF2188 domain-containing protein [Paenibacillus sp. JX-17]|uniref:DUF2188 domain-containing protein n=1 Tax=Paenibacillus lacisoli TaxID=3064525 RepID=A0ABT9C6F7_9BACL|nr:DUF2188 domain-containing protein [Paenibacillus sp. JX-17]MDO7904848.1 DUF2188 domain-containing protein [Paenibacillus sp. JX-17]
MTDKRKQFVHVTPDPGEGGWQIQREGRKLGGEHTKEETVKEAREEAKEYQTELKVHNRDGKISESTSYGHDPFPPKG